MKNFLLAVILGFCFSFGFSQTPEYDVGETVVKVHLDQGGSDSLLTSVDLINVRTTINKDSLCLSQVEVEKVNYNSSSYFVAIKTKVNNLEYLYCSKLFPKQIESSSKNTYKEKDTLDTRIKTVVGSSGGLPRLC